MPIPLRADYDAAGLRAAARRTKDAAQARRLLALAAVYDGVSRTEAARIGGVTVQIARDWVVRFNAQGPTGLVDRKAPGHASRLNHTHRAALAEVLESGPIPAIHGVVRWRLIDLCQWLWEEHRVTAAKQTMSREVRALGYRKLSARPRHHAQAEDAIENFKKPSPPAWRTSRARKASPPAPSRSGSPMRPVWARRTRSLGAGPGAAPGPRRRMTSVRRRPTSSAPSAPRRARQQASSCPTATPQP